MTSSPFPTQKTMWRVLRNEPADGAWNMAVDETLMAYVRASGTAVLRVYGWSVPTLSFGRNQAAVGRYDHRKMRAAGVDCVRRPTGGRAVLHHREVTYSVVALESGLGSLRDSYARINNLLLSALSLLGVGATASPGGNRSASEVRAVAHGATPCFDQASRGELVLDGRKLVGSAQWRDGDVLLQHGSILTRDDQSLIMDLLVDPAREKSVPATLAEAMGREPDLGEVADALVAAVAAVENTEPELFTTSDLPAADLAAAHARYSDEKWTWRR